MCSLALTLFFLNCKSINDGGKPSVKDYTRRLYTFTLENENEIQDSAILKISHFSWQNAAWGIFIHVRI